VTFTFLTSIRSREYPFIVKTGADSDINGKESRATRKSKPLNLKKIAEIVPLLSILIAPLFLAFWSQESFDPEKLIDAAKTAMASVDSYTAVFHKQERINGNLTKEETIFIKFKRPFSVYMKWIKDPFKGRECLYVQGANNNRIKAHEGGILDLIKLNLDPLNSRAMKGNRHPITEVGLENLIRLIGMELQRGISAGEIQVKDLGEEMIYARKTRKIESIFPKEKGYFCFRAVVNLDTVFKVPIRSMIYDWRDQLIENYGYEEFKLNAGLTAADFDPKNPEYKF